MWDNLQVCWLFRKSDEIRWPLLFIGKLVVDLGPQDLLKKTSKTASVPSSREDRREKMARIDPRVDFAFKKIFGSEDNKDLTIALINAILDDEKQITEITFTNPYTSAGYFDSKVGIVDISAKDQLGRWYNIEMQMSLDVDFEKRALFYLSRLYSSQLTKGKSFNDLKKTISINLLNFDMIKDEPHYHNIFKLINTRNQQPYGDHIELHIIELNKLKTDFSQLKYAIERWTKFLQVAGLYDTETLPDELKSDPMIKKAMYVLDTVYLTSEERAMYDQRLKEKRIIIGNIKASFEKGVDKGIEKGVEQGMKQGRGEGIEFVARNMLDMGLSIRDVADATGLSTDVVETLEIIQSKTET